jgi:hypothetical protein
MFSLFFTCSAAQWFFVTVDSRPASLKRTQPSFILTDWKPFLQRQDSNKCAQSSTERQRIGHTFNVITAFFTEEYESLILPVWLTSFEESGHPLIVYMLAITKQKPPPSQEDETAPFSQQDEAAPSSQEDETSPPFQVPSEEDNAASSDEAVGQAVSTPTNAAVPDKVVAAAAASPNTADESASAPNNIYEAAYEATKAEEAATNTDEAADEATKADEAADEASASHSTNAFSTKAYCGDLTDYDDSAMDCDDVDYVDGDDLFEAVVTDLSMVGV